MQRPKTISSTPLIFPTNKCTSYKLTQLMRGCDHNFCNFSSMSSQSLISNIALDEMWALVSSCFSPFLFNVT